MELYKKSRILAEIRTVIKTKCMEHFIKYIDEWGPNPMSDMVFAGATQWPLAFIDDKFTKYSQEICFFSSICRVQHSLDHNVLYNNALDKKGFIVQLCHPGLFHTGYAGMQSSLFNTIDNENHFGDLEWTIANMKSKLEELNISGRFATWRVPFTIAATAAAVEYAIGYCEGEIENKADIDAMRECFRKAMELYNAGDIGFELNIDPEHDNHFMFTEDYIVL